MFRPFLSGVLLISFFAIGSSWAWANGGGYSRGGVSDSGTILGFEPAGMKGVSISDEQLDIALGRSAAQVEVRYVLRNAGERKAAVRFGFPVEELAGEPIWGYEAAAKERKRSTRGELQYCRDYQVVFGGKPVPAKFQQEPGKSKAADKRFAGIKGWLVSEISLGPREEKSMTIRFRADYPYEGKFVSDDAHESARTFKYRLSTGAAWDGPIERGRVTIRAAGIDPGEVRILRPVNRFRRSGSQWEWEFSKLEPTLADDLVIEAIPAEFSYSGRSESGKSDHWGEKAVQLIDRAGKWYVLPPNYEVTASSTLRAKGSLSYDAANVRMPDRDKVWSEGVPGPGIGEWIEIKPEVARPVRSVRIHPGHSASQELFHANARPKRVECLVNGEHRFEATLDDSDEEQTIFVQGYDKPVKMLRLIIRDVYPGTRHEDTCISSIRLETRALRTPKIQPAR
jgi:hypothetical protein